MVVRLTNREAAPWVGALVIALGIVSLVSLLLYIYDARQNVECQRHVNSIFFSTLKDRSELFERDRNAMQDLIDASVAAQGDREKGMKALKEFNRKEDRLDEALKKYDYPSLNGECVYPDVNNKKD